MRKNSFLAISFFLLILATAVLAHPADRAERGFHLNAVDIIPAALFTTLFLIIGVSLYFFLNRENRRKKWVVPDKDKSSINKAYSLMWTGFFFIIVAFSVGISWDKKWHITNPFEDFYSAPHLFIYAIVALGLLNIFILAKSKDSKWFGSHLVFNQIPASLFVFIGGAFTIMFAGLIDDFWHTNIGLDETLWSTPHSMLGFGFFLLILGLIVGVRKLSDHKPKARLLPYFLAFLLLSSSAVLMGPLGKSNTPENVQAIASIPVLKESPDAQHAFRISLKWNLTHTNPIFILLGAFWLGIMFCMIRKFFPSMWILIITSLIVTLISSNRKVAEVFGIADNPQTWLPLPIFPAALVLAVCLYFGFSERWSWVLTGFVFNLIIWLIWVQTGLGILFVLIGIFLVLLGVRVGKTLSEKLMDLNVRSAWIITLIIGFGIPLFTGIIDLILRSLTP